MNKEATFRSAHHPPDSLARFIQLFLDKKEAKGLSSFTVTHYFFSLHPLIEALPKRPCDITTIDLKRYVDEKNLELSGGTMRPTVGDIKTFFRWLKKKKHIPKNPAKKLKKPRHVVTTVRAVQEANALGLVRFLVGELGELIYRDLFGTLQPAAGNWSFESYKHLQDLFSLMFLYETGCRAGELCNLTAKQMSGTVNHVAVAYTVILTGKTGARRYHFTQRTAELWGAWSRKRPFASRFAIVSWKRGHQPERARTNGLSQMLVRRCKQAGIRPFRCHALRHAYVRRSRQIVGLELTSRLIDHSDISVTQMYANVDNEELQAAARRTGFQGDLFM